MNATKLVRICFVLALFSVPGTAWPQVVEDSHDRQQIAIEVEYACSKLGYFEQHWMRLAARHMFEGSGAEKREAEARQRDPNLGAADERKRQAAAYVERGAALGCGKEADAYLVDAVSTGWVEAGVALQTAAQFDVMPGQYARKLTDEQKQLGSVFLATIRSRFGDRMPVVEGLIDQRMMQLAPKRASGFANPATAPATYIEMAFTADPLFTSVRFVQAMNKAGFVPHEVRIGDEVGTLLTPAQPGGQRYLALARAEEFQIPIALKQWAPAIGFPAVGEDGSLVIAVIQPEAAALPAGLRAILTARRGAPGHGTLLASNCPGTLCFAFKPADQESQSGSGTTTHDALITARANNYPEEGAREAITVRTLLIKTARDVLAARK